MLPLHLLGAPLSAAIVVSRTPDAEDCPDADRLGTRVERIVGRPVATAQSTPDAVVVNVAFARSGHTYEATVRLTGAREGERFLRDDGPTCEGLSDAVAVTTALLFNPALLASPEPARRVAEPPSPRWEAWVAGRAGAGAGLVKGATWIAGGEVAVSLGPLTSVEIGGAVTGSRAAELGAGSVALRLWYVEVGGFRSLTGKDFRFGPCLQLLGGAMSGKAEGYLSSSSALLAWFAAGAGVWGDVRLGSSFRLGARALLLVPTRKEAFSVRYVGTAYESSPVAGVAEFGLGVKFW